MKAGLSPLLSQYIVKPRVITPEEAPHLHAVMEDFAQRLNVSKPPLMLSHTPVPNAMMLFMKDGSQRLMVTEGLLHSAGMKSLVDAPTAGMKGLIAHELGHLKEGEFFHTKYKYAPLFAMPALAVGATYLLSRALSHQDAPQARLDAVVDEEQSALAAEACTDKTTSTGKHQLLQGAAYLAASALGLGAGLAMVRNHPLASERYADSVAARLCGNPAEYAELLLKLEKDTVELVRAQAQKLLSQPDFKMPYASSSSATFREALGNLRRSVTAQFKQALELEVYSAHPGFAERAAAIRLEKSAPGQIL